MTELLTKAAYEDNMRCLARGAFENHALVDRSATRWLLRRERGSWSEETEIAVVGWNRVIVHGAVDTVMVLGDTSVTPEDRVRALARSYMDRFAKETHAAMQIDVTQNDNDVAAGDLLRRAAEQIEQNVCDYACEDNDLDPDAPDYATDQAAFTFLAFVSKLVDELDETDDTVTLFANAARELLDDGAWLDDVRRDLIENDVDSESLRHLGEVYIPRLYYAQAALQRLVALWDAERAATEVYHVTR